MKDVKVPEWLKSLASAVPGWLIFLLFGVLCLLVGLMAADVGREPLREWFAGHTVVTGVTVSLLFLLLTVGVVDTIVKRADEERQEREKQAEQERQAREKQADKDREEAKRQENEHRWKKAASSYLREITDAWKAYHDSLARTLWAFRYTPVPFTECLSGCIEIQRSYRRLREAIDTSGPVLTQTPSLCIVFARLIQLSIEVRPQFVHVNGDLKGGPLAKWRTQFPDYASLASRPEADLSDAESTRLDQLRKSQNGFYKQVYEMVLRLGITYERSMSPATSSLAADLARELAREFPSPALSAAAQPIREASDVTTEIQNLRLSERVATSNFKVLATALVANELDDAEAFKAVEPLIGGPHLRFGSSLDEGAAGSPTRADRVQEAINETLTALEESSKGSEALRVLVSRSAYDPATSGIDDMYDVLKWGSLYPEGLAPGGLQPPSQGLWFVDDVLSVPFVGGHEYPSCVDPEFEAGREIPSSTPRTPSVLPEEKLTEIRTRCLKTSYPDRAQNLVDFEMACNGRTVSVKDHELFTWQRSSSLNAQPTE